MQIFDPDYLTAQVYGMGSPDSGGGGETWTDWLTKKLKPYFDWRKQDQEKNKDSSPVSRWLQGVGSTPQVQQQLPGALLPPALSQQPPQNVPSPPYDSLPPVTVPRQTQPETPPTEPGQIPGLAQVQNIMQGFNTRITPADWMQQVGDVIPQPEKPKKDYLTPLSLGLVSMGSVLSQPSWNRGNAMQQALSNVLMAKQGQSDREQKYQDAVANRQVRMMQLMSPYLQATSKDYSWFKPHAVVNAKGETVGVSPFPVTKTSEGSSKFNLEQGMVDALSRGDMETYASLYRTKEGLSKLAHPDVSFVEPEPGRTYPAGTRPMPKQDPLAAIMGGQGQGKQPTAGQRIPVGNLDSLQTQGYKMTGQKDAQGNPVVVGPDGRRYVYKVK